MDFFRRFFNHNNNNNNGDNDNDNTEVTSEAANNENNENACQQNNQNERLKKKQIAEYTNIRDIPLHRLQFVEYRGGDSLFLLRISITFAIITIVSYIVLSYIIDLNIKDYEPKWKRIFTNIFISYSSGVSFIFITWGVAFYFVSHVISQRIDAELLHNEYNIDGNKILYIRGSIPDFYYFKKELTKGCSIKLVKVPFLFNTKQSNNYYSKKIEDYIPYNSYTYNQFHTNDYYYYQNNNDTRSTSAVSLDSIDSINNKPRSINTIQRAINNSSRLEKILIATPINLAS
ncbi:hypothetical protein BCR32DRAFT_268898 [Anaeromyces robustus]|uniref:Uncharacterized protein n=1 Tax=Anaeromyces robustus TaxID=1754192 RepID=A0A1Y1X4Y3_9FUNG|nr:hypothetical protein BCR32DRAFT_268898 [Anaeromyces robustus]|eukprot:ORX80416.1 hypothetical protein BCR32DRAFT_268898 [Anaeromyces robustus]